MKPTKGEDVAPSGAADEDVSHEKQVRETVVYVLSIASGVSTFAVGFGILPSSTAVEKVLILLAALSISAAIIFGIGAWHSARRFMLMATCAGLGLVFLCALSVVPQQSTTRPQAQGAESPAPSYGGQPTVGASARSPTPTVASSSALAAASAPSSPGAANAPSSLSAAKVLTWHGQITIPAGDGAPASYTDLSQPSLAGSLPAPFTTSNYSYDQDIYASSNSATEVTITANPAANSTYLSQWNGPGIPGFSQCESVAQGGANSVTIERGGTFCFKAPNNTVGEFTVLSVDNDFSSPSYSTAVVKGTIWWSQGTP
jgi:hypothetical protein